MKKKTLILFALLLCACSGSNTTSDSLESSSSSISEIGISSEQSNSDISKSESLIEEPSSSENFSESLTSDESNSGSNLESNENSTQSEESSTSQSISESSSSNEISDNDEESKIDHITLNKSSLDLVVGKYEYLTVNFYPDDETTADLHDGYWTTSDENIASVSKYGKVTALKEGKAIITFTTIEGNRRANCTVFVFQNETSIKKEYLKVTDADSIVPGDQIVFGCPEFGVAASLDRVDGYLRYTKTSFSNDGTKILSLGDNAGEYIVGEGIDNALTLESQENKYLCGKSNDYRNSLLFVNNNGPKNWIFETPEGYEHIYCVSYDIDDDLWLMFNKISDNDIRFNLYDSNPTALMVMPTIYRLTVIRN